MKHHGGYATILALMMLALVSMATVVLFELASTDGRRTVREATAAQLRQLLHAGAVDAAGRLNSASSPQSSWDLSLPSGLKVHVKLELADQRCTANILAQADEESLGQVVVFTKTDDRWVAESAELTGR